MTIAIIVYIVICILAILVFLLQQTETGGMGIIGGSSNNLLGASRTSFLGKVANFFSVLFFVSAFYLSVLSSGERSLFKDENLNEVLEEAAKTSASSVEALEQENLETSTENEKISTDSEPVNQNEDNY